MAPRSESGLSLPTSMACQFLECMDMQQVMDELSNVERVCNAMIARLPSAHPPNECFSDNSQAGVQDNAHTNNIKSEFPMEAYISPSPARSPAPVFVDLSSDDESHEDGEVVQGSMVVVPANNSPPSQQSPFPKFESNQLNRKAEGVNNGGPEDVDYEAHVFQVPRGLLKVNDSEVDEATWNERAELLAGLYKAEFNAGIEESRSKKKQKGGKKEKVTFMQDQLIFIDSGNEKDGDKNRLGSAPSIDVSVSCLDLGHTVSRL